MTSPFALARHWLVTHEDALSVLIFFAIVIGAIWAVNGASRIAFRHLAKRGEAAESLWRPPFFTALARPFRFATWLVGLTVIAGYLTKDGHLPLVTRFFPPFRDLAAIAILLWFAFGLLRRIEWRFGSTPAARHNIEPAAADALGKLARIVLVLVGILMAMPILGFSVSGVMAFGGIGGIAIGFAAQGLVANLFGGLTIYASRPFTVGETIILPSAGIEGEVQEIGWRATRIMGFDQRPAYVPNALFNTAVVINFSRMTGRRIQENILLRHEDAPRIPAIVADVTAMLREHPGLQPDSFSFQLDGCTESAFRLQLSAFTPDRGYAFYTEAKQDILLKIAEIVRRHGAEMARPASEIYAPRGIGIRSDGALPSQGTQELDTPA